jgi:dihydrodipicolinate synthase/N-acetylneuraminate lyase
VAEASRVPLLVYNIPQRTGISMSAGLFERLLQIPSIVGMKDSSGDIFALGLYFSHGRKPIIFQGEDTVLLAGLLAGACGGIGATYNIMPQLFVRLWRCVQANDLLGAAAAQARINQIISALMVVDLFGGLKQTLAWMDLPCGEPRSPNRALTAEETAKLRSSLEGVNFFDE